LELKNRKKPVDVLRNEVVQLCVRDSLPSGYSKGSDYRFGVSFPGKGKHNQDEDCEKKELSFPEHDDLRNHGVWPAISGKPI